MTSKLPDIIHGFNETGSAGVVVVNGVVHESIAGLVTAYPVLSEPANVRVLAAAANHIARNQGYEIIQDPPAFEAAYRAQIATEDPTAPWIQGAYKLCDYGMPDFSLVAPPRISDATLVFYAVDAVVGLPYRAEIGLEPDAAEPTYLPMSLTPLPPVPALPVEEEDEDLPQFDDPDDNIAEPEGELPDLKLPPEID